MVNDSEWYLLKAEEGKTYGPVPLRELTSWAIDAKISPMDRVSNDGQTSWLRAPMVPELQMNWLVELDDGDYLYGPTSVGAIFEFLDSGEIDDSVTIINCKENERTTVGECAIFKNQPRRVRSGSDAQLLNSDSDASIPQLKAMNLKLQNELAAKEEAYQALRKLYEEATGLSAAN